jgi:hypothetical protein
VLLFKEFTMNSMRNVGAAAVILGLGLLVSGCEGRAAGASGGARKFSGVEREAADAALAEVGKHCVKGPEGWTTAAWEGTSFAPIEFVRQFKVVAVDEVESYPLSSSDKLNGFEWAGEVKFQKTPVREAGEQGYVMDGVNTSVVRQRGRWSQWIDYQPFAIKVQKVKGHWQVDPDATLLRGRIPTAAEYAKAGVKP